MNNLILPQKTDIANMLRSIKVFGGRTKFFFFLGMVGSVLTSCKPATYYYPSKSQVLKHDKVISLDKCQLNFGQLVDSAAALKWRKTQDTILLSPVYIDDFTGSIRDLLTVTTDGILVNELHYPLEKLDTMWIAHYQNNGRNPALASSSYDAGFQVLLPQQASSRQLKELLIRIVDCFERHRHILKKDEKLRVALRLNIPQAPPPPNNVDFSFKSLSHLPV